MGESYFRVEIDGSSRPVRVTAAGELDAASADQLATALTDAQRAAAGIALDLTDVTFIDSSGLRVIAAEVARADDTGEAFTISGASDAVRRIFEMTGLSALLAS